MNTHLYLEAALFSVIAGGLPSAAVGQAPEVRGAVSSVWSSRDQVVYVRILPELTSGPETETALQLSDGFGRHEISPSSEVVLICEPEQSMAH